MSYPILKLKCKDLFKKKRKKERKEERKKGKKGNKGKKTSQWVQRPAVGPEITFREKTHIKY